MVKVFFGVFIILHGLVHMWYFTLSQKLVTFQADMGWTGKSWLFTNALGDTATRSLAGLLYALATIVFAVGGIGFMIQQDWWRPVAIGSAIFSSAILILFWDGSLNLLVEKGLLGLLINLAILIGLLVFNWPPVKF